ncbi:MAG: rRNA maturation RNase YbeY [Epulopiscium sp.]|jgi:probable rRNA maturation factor|nr:rRNA maturation RNase YbeY [Candidatus Epulonipiscium sp.]
MTVLIDNRTQEELSLELEKAIEKVITESLIYEDFDRECEISVSIVDNEEIQQINHQFRGIDKPTDVLSFPQLSFTEGECADVNEKDEIILGDIIISLERAKEQAQEYGHSLKREIAFLTAHSMLHLMGYDHMEQEEEEEMFTKQKEILLQAGFPREVK